jgi:hypothetical protein
VAAQEQGQAQPVLQRAHQLAHGRRGDVQLLRGQGEAAVARAGLEGPQRIQVDRRFQDGFSLSKAHIIWFVEW